MISNNSLSVLNDEPEPSIPLIPQEITAIDSGVNIDDIKRELKR
jgi:hypothetical protein